MLNRRSRYGQSGGTVTKVPLKGLFSDGIWKCNCNSQLPAQHFRVKNGGKNHGRWFYTCQLPQTKRCDFFLWADEAKAREEAAVLNNSRTEPARFPDSPGKPPPNGLPTPQTERRARFADDDNVQTPYTPSKPERHAHGLNLKTKDDTQHTATTATTSDEEFYDWPASDDEAIGKAADKVSSQPSSASKPPMHPPETPRKALKTDIVSSPGKRTYEEMAGPTTTLPTPTSAHSDSNIFTTPQTGPRNSLFGYPTLPSPADTTTPVRYKDLPSNQDSQLATEILVSLEKALSAPLFTEAREQVKGICNRHVMYTKGVMKGRDVSREMVKQKEARIVELMGEIDGLKSEREMDTGVVRSLRQEVAVLEGRKKG